MDSTLIKKRNEQKIKLETPKDYLKCVRNELRPENKETLLGLHGLLQYKLDDVFRTGDPDSMYLQYNKHTRLYEGKSYAHELFYQIYGCVDESSDTIFNCWSFFRMYKEAKINRNRMLLDEMDRPLFIGCGGLPELFNGHEDIWQLLDELADLHHCLANIMPAPMGYNGFGRHDGKGNWARDNDMPDIYYKRSQNDFLDKYLWINKNWDKYCLSFFADYTSPWSDGEANKPLDLENKNAVEFYKKAITDAISAIKNRAVQLYDLGHA